MTLFLWIYLPGFFITAIWLIRAKMGFILTTIGAVLWFITIWLLIAGWKTRG